MISGQLPKHHFDWPKQKLKSKVFPNPSFPYHCKHKILQVDLLLARRRLANWLPMLWKLSQSMLWALSLQILCHQHHPLMFLPSNSDRSTSVLLQLMFLPRPTVQNMQLGANFIQWVSNMGSPSKYKDSTQDISFSAATMFSKPTWNK